MKKKSIDVLLVRILAATALAAGMGAQATDAPATGQAAESSAGDALDLEEVVVTATAGDKSKMRSSVSVTDVSSALITDFAPRSEAELLHLIPGIRAESSAGPGGNSNIAVRGLPIASGGSKFVQLQEDGLPVVEFGDMNFGNNDYFIRYDTNVDRVEALRGGSAATFASQAPGAVINYISKTGTKEGGAVALTSGLNYRETRVDADYGGKISETMRFHIGGYFRDGEGPRKTDTGHALHGYQVKGNLTKTFNDDKGYVRLSFKILDENAPTYTGMPALASVSGSSVTDLHSIPNLDIRTDSQLSIYNQTMPVIGPNGRATGIADIARGISVNSNTFGVEFHNELDGGVSLDDKFKTSKAKSAFQTQFWSSRTLPDLLGGFGAGSSAVYYNGPLAGQTVSAANLQTGLVSQGAAINEQSPDMGHYVNDLSLGKSFDFNGPKLNVKLGYYRSNQDIVQVWQISERVMEVARNGALIDVKNAAGALLTTAGLTGYNNQWGGCCARNVDAHYTTDSPYLSLGLEAGPVDVDASFRHDSFRAAGSYAGPKQVTGGVDVNGDGVINGAEKNVYLVDISNPNPINYRTSYNSYSFGVNYRITNDLSVFARTSKGGRAIADRLLFSPFVDTATGGLTPGLEANAVATVKQSELGVKFRGDFNGGSYGVFATLFKTDTDEYDYDQTRTVGPKLNVIGTGSKGLEIESVLNVGNFGVNVNLVYLKMETTKDLVGAAQQAAGTGQSSVGYVPGGVPKIAYTIVPHYTIGPVNFGAVIVGQSYVFNNQFNTAKVDGRYIVNAFATYDLSKSIALSLNATNLFDVIASSGGVGGPSAANIVELRPETGRSLSASVRYSY